MINFLHHHPRLACAVSGVISFGVLQLSFGVLAALAVMLVIVAHELGHYFMARAVGARAVLPLFLPLIIGVIGVTRVYDHAQKNKFAIYFGGPAAGVMMAGAIVAFGVIVLPAWVWVGLVLAGWECYSGTFGSDGRKIRKYFNV